MTGTAARPITRRRLLLGTGAAPLQAQPRRPNIVLFLADDLGLADLGCYGSTTIRTPEIDRLAREGVTFTQAYSNGPLSGPTRAGLITGRYQQRVGIEYAWTPLHAGMGLFPSEVTLPRLLRFQDTTSLNEEL